MQAQMILSQIPLSDLEQIIKKCVTDALASTPTPTAAPEPTERFNIGELAKYLKVTKATIHAYKKRGVFNFYQTGRTVYFLKNEVDKALEVTGKKKGARNA